MRRIHHTDDFLLRLPDDRLCPAPGVDFEGTLYTDHEPERGFTFSMRGGEGSACRRHAGHIEVAVRDHSLGVGPLVCRVRYKLPDPAFPSGVREVDWRFHAGVELTRSGASSAHSSPAEYMPPWVKGDPGDPFDIADITPEMLGDLAARLAPLVGAETEPPRISEDELLELISD